MTRLFVTFKADSTLRDKAMVFTDMTNHQVRQVMAENYGNSWSKVYSEAEFAQVLPMIYCFKNQWVEFGEECKYKESCGYKTYPSKYVEEHSVTVKPITDWFKTAKPSPTQKDSATQLGATLEEVSEMLNVFSKNSENTDLQNQAVKAYLETKRLSDLLYKTEELPELSNQEKVELLDSFADIVVTLTGSAYMLGMKFDEALSEVNTSNFSKFENGKPVLNENGKIMKGHSYFKPNLEEFV